MDNWDFHSLEETDIGKMRTFVNTAEVKRDKLKRHEN